MRINEHLAEMDSTGEPPVIRKNHLADVIFKNKTLRQANLERKKDSADIILV